MFQILPLGLVLLLDLVVHFHQVSHVVQRYQAVQLDLGALALLWYQVYLAVLIHLADQSLLYYQVSLLGQAAQRDQSLQVDLVLLALLSVLVFQVDPFVLEVLENLVVQSHHVDLVVHQDLVDLEVQKDLFDLVCLVFLQGQSHLLGPEILSDLVYLEFQLPPLDQEIHLAPSLPVGQMVLFHLLVH